MNYRIITYLTIGTINTIIDTSILYVLLTIFGITTFNIATFNVVSYTVAVICGFFLNGKFTFKDNNLTLKKFIKLYISAAFGVVINTVIVVILIENLMLSIIISKLLAACIVAIYNYTMCHKFIYTQ